MSRGRGSRGTDVFDDFDPADIVAQANAKKGGGGEAAAAAAPPPRRKRKPRVDPWVRTPFNSKVPRWIRSATRAFADQTNQDLQDLHGAALVALMEAHGFDVDAFRPDPEVSPAPKHAAKLDKLLSDDWPTDDDADEPAAVAS